MLDKLKSKLVKLREDTEILAKDAFLKNKVSDEIQKQRYDICVSCPHLNMDSNRCKICGCFMGVKTYMPNEQCPINKWGPVKNEIN